MALKLMREKSGQFEGKIRIAHCPHHPVPSLTRLYPYITKPCIPTSLSCSDISLGSVRKLPKYLCPRMASRTLASIRGLASLAMSTRGSASLTMSFASTSALAPSSNLHSSACPLRKAKWSDVWSSCSSMCPWNDQYLVHLLTSAFGSHDCVHKRGAFVSASEWFDIFAHYPFNIYIMAKNGAWDKRKAWYRAAISIC